MRAGLIGDGIGGSLTPAMHEEEGRAQGLDYRYERLDTSAAPWRGVPLAEILDHAQKAGFAGLNVTHPHKEAVVDLLDELDGASRDLGVANTVLFREGKRIGLTTDYLGFRRALSESNLPVADRQVAQFGAGGAGASTALALIDEGARLTVTDLREEKAAALAATLRKVRPDATITHAPTAQLDLSGMEAAVNATPLGMLSHPGMAFEPSRLPPGAWVADIVYFPLRTALVCAAEAEDRPVLTGAAMALYQAVEAFELITGRPADADRMRASLARLIEERDARDAVGAK